MGGSISDQQSINSLGQYYILIFMEKKVAFLRRQTKLPDKSE